MIFLMKDEETIKKHLEYLGKSRHILSSTYFLEKEQGQNAEYYLYAEEAIRRGIDTYWLGLDNIGNCENETTDVKLYHLNSKKAIKTKISELDKLSDTLVIRTIGNVTERIDLIKKVMLFLKKNYHGDIINNPDYILYGSNKRYLLDLQNANLPVIPTDFYIGEQDIRTIQQRYDDPKKFIIKPAVGELSKGFYKLSDITMDWWKRKNTNDYGEHGWIVQPLKEEVFEGEYQLIFFGDEFSHGQIKMAGKKEDGTPSQATRTIQTNYRPNQDEINLCMDIKAQMEDTVRKQLHFFRCDFFKDKFGHPSVLEFEMCNPGFFFHKRERKEDLEIAKHFLDSISKGR